jgi:glycosyltransferase involved in cell wall biosynthesis
MVCRIEGDILKILQIYYEPLLSGQTTHVQSLSKGLVLRGHDVTVVLPDILRTVSKEYMDSGVKVVTLPMRKLVWPMKSNIELLNLLRQERYEIVHVHSQEAGIIARCVAWIGRAQKIYYTPQTIDIRLTKWQNLYILIERMLAQITNRIFSVNHIDAKRLINWGIPKDKVRVVPNGIELSQFRILESREDICRRLGLNPDLPVVMQVGRLNTQKDPIMFLRGAGYVLTGNSDAQLVWIGEGPLLMRVKSEIESLQLQYKIRLLGRIDQAYRCLAAADVVTSTSIWEGLSYSILEGMACSKPIVSTAVNGSSEAVINGKTGYLVDTGDAVGWAKSVLRLIADPQLAHSMGCAGKRLVEEKYSLSKMISQIEQVYIEN